MARGVAGIEIYQLHANLDPQIRSELLGLPAFEGLGPLRLHDLRHNVVSWDVSRGVPLEIAGKNVGHRSRRSTEVYAHFDAY